MRITDYRTGAPGPRVDSEEEALVVLRDDVEEHFHVLFAETISYAHTSDRSGRSGSDVLRDSAVLSAVISPNRPPRAIERPWRGRKFAFDSFAAQNVELWPLSEAELRRDGDWADASLTDLAGELNRRQRREAAEALRECADLASAVKPGESFAETITVWSRFCAASGLGALSVDEIAEAVAAGPVAWGAASEWTPQGGVGGDPFTVCRYRWGPVHAEARLEPAELLARHIAGEAPLTLYRLHVDYGRGPHEIIWPRQHISCCGQDPVVDAASPPLRITDWGQRGAAPVAAARQCLICGSIRYASWLTCRAVDRAAPLPLGIVETLDALPAKTLAAARDAGLHTVAPELPAKPLTRTIGGPCE